MCQEIDILRKYHEAGLSIDEFLRKRCVEDLFERNAKMYFFISKIVFRKCGLQDRGECIGLIEKGSWNTGSLGMGLAEGHKEAVEKYHPMPDKLSKTDFEEKILPKINEQDSSYLKRIYDFNKTSSYYMLKSDITEDSFFRRWDIAVSIGFMVTKFSSFAYSKCIRKTLYYCSHNCIYIAEYKERLRTITPESYKRVLTYGNISDFEKELVKNLYAYSNRERVYKLKIGATPAQIIALFNIIIKYPPPNEDSPPLTPEEVMILSQIIGLLIKGIEESSLIEQQMLYLFMKDIQQKCTGRLLSMSEVNVSRRLRQIESTLSGKIGESTNIPGGIQMAKSYFYKAYKLYVKRNKKYLYWVRKKYIGYLRWKRFKRYWTNKEVNKPELFYNG
jgi:hypothetical protein